MNSDKAQGKEPGTLVGGTNIQSKQPHVLWYKSQAKLKETLCRSHNWVVKKHQEHSLKNSQK